MLLTDDERKRFTAYLETQILSNNLLARQLKGTPLHQRYQQLTTAYILVLQDTSAAEPQAVEGPSSK